MNQAAALAELEDIIAICRNERRIPFWAHYVGDAKRLLERYDPLEVLFVVDAKDQFDFARLNAARYITSRFIAS